jgi:enoyl-CoA hydratase/carnithine racemase
MTRPNHHLETVEIVANGEIGYLRLNRTQALNAFNLTLMKEIVSAAEWFDDNKEIKVVVIEGNGRSFCAGFDMDYFSEMASPEKIREIVDLGNKLANKVTKMRTVTIASVQGHCIGGGVVLMGACDFRYASKTASFLLPETQLGIPLAWGGIPRLMREIGPLRTAEFTLLAERISASDALSMGMLNEVLEEAALKDRVSVVANRLASLSSLVIETTKQQLVAAKEELASNAYSYCDAHLLHTALLDEGSKATRQRYVQEMLARKNAR